MFVSVCVTDFGAGDSASESDLPKRLLPARRREGQRMFGLLHFAQHCVIKIMGCGSTIHILLVRKREFADMGVLHQ